MASFTTVCLALALLVALNEAATISLNASPTTIDPQSTHDLIITCTVFDSGNRDFGNIYELQIKRDGSLVAIFNEASAPVGTDDISKAHVTGDLSGTSGTQATITVTYHNPPAELSGNYVCEAIGVDEHGHNRQVSGSISVTSV